jgi:hypothetical protein
MKQHIDQEMYEYTKLSNKEADNNPTLIYLQEPNEFSSTKTIEYPNQEDLQQVREWKNRVIEIRDKYKGTELYVTFDLEAKRLVAFLNNFIA